MIEDELKYEWGNIRNLFYSATFKMHNTIKMTNIIINYKK